LAPRTASNCEREMVRSMGSLARLAFGPNLPCADRES
jgi:hypothetical protein